MPDTIRLWLTFGGAVTYNAALREVGNRLVGILHGCLKTTNAQDQTTAWPHRTRAAAA